jgi:hypothetical protein
MYGSNTRAFKPIDSFANDDHVAPFKAVTSFREDYAQIKARVLF